MLRRRLVASSQPSISSSLLILLLLSFFVGSSHAYFNAANLQTVLPFKSVMASTQRNSSLVLFGGENATNSYTNDLFQLTQTSTGFTWTALPQNNTPPPNSFGRSVYIDGSDAMMLLGGITQDTNNQLVPLQMYLYDFASGNWQPWAGNSVNTSSNASLAIPPNRKEFSVSLDNQNSRVYVYGGSVNQTIVWNDLWVLDLSTMAYSQLPSSDVARYGHTTSLLSNGQLVVIGGVIVTSTGDTGLASMGQLYIFDTRTSTWSMQNTTVTGGGLLPSTRSAHNAVVGANDQIVIFGGDSGGDERTRRYINAVALLDTASWTWTVPTAQGIPPSRRSYAAAAILDGTHMTVAFGASLNMQYNDINVLSLDSGKWLQTFEPEESEESSGLSAGVIAGICIAAVVLLLIILFLLWRFQSYVRWLVTRLHGDIWRPRAGEPVWAETTRMCCKVLLLFVFVACLFFIIRQAITSPSVIQRIEEPVAQVDVPDVRFCFEGYPSFPSPMDPRNPGVVCQTDIGFSCSEYVQALNMSVFTPVYASGLGAVTCFLFRAPKYFQMTATSGANNGSRLLFYPFGDQSVTYGRVHVSLYPKEMDPNVKLFGIQDDIPVVMSDMDVLNWMNGERNDIQVSNVYDLQPNSYGAISYELVDHQYLQDVGWNYVGFSPITNSTPEIETNFRQEAPNPNYTATHPSLGQMVIYPSGFVHARDREVKMYTLLNALGFVGGIFGLLLALQTWLFGYRPRSPWGVVQRWSIGDMKRSLLEGLSSNFRTASETGIPFIHPVHRRFSVLNAGDIHESERERVSRVEERMQILELLFKAYYVDDEVFRSLDNANRRETGIVPTSDSGPLFPPSLFEKDEPSSSRDSQERGFSSGFHHRSASTTSSDGTPSSRQPLNNI
ncbi:hypothetical protein BDB00DRAFT_266955 [Zychaea mexicana]|uniref:uncharacterized protein n=1 Tax=Zychaea mexicana TaxID=64656 RepID=UPI0022FDBE05|nr:uncharacterized protein BDB00DRAFT_266955 [Zychaea mexicana]KAI9495036.1 hypothetical protein BDB00DRAFT_266955 [Zychaea mexicana]